MAGSSLEFIQLLTVTSIYRDYRRTHDHEVKKLFVKGEQGTGPVSLIFVPTNPKVKKGRGWDSTFLRPPGV